jgi:quercetin dioxygenase-like cupin family protein
VHAAVVVLLGAAVGCAAPHAPAPRPALSQAATVDAAVADAPVASEPERLAAIEHAMNQLDEAAQACWAAAAVVDFELEGELTAQIDIVGPGVAHPTLVRDTARAPRLASCLTEILAAYPWAPPLYGQTIQLPFRFRAPDGQSVIDRRLVPSAGQGGVSVAVLLDDKNTGNADASMFEVVVAAGASTGRRLTERAELWYALTAGTFEDVASGVHAVAAGDMVFVPAGGARTIRAGASELRAVVIAVPGGREGAARAGALPTRALGDVTAAPIAPIYLPASRATAVAGEVRYAGPATIKSQALTAAMIELPVGAAVHASRHEHASEYLYVLAGGGVLTVDGVDLAVMPTSVIQVPAGARHALTIQVPLRAVQILTSTSPAHGARPEHAP